MSGVARLPAWLIPRLPFHYGWIILACACCAGFARQGPAVATLSIFIAPMSSELGWSRTAMSGAVSLGGILAALTSPMIGPFSDRHGARAILCIAVFVTGAALMALSLAQSLLVFYLMFCIARMNFAGPFDLGIYGALNNWFVARRPMATSVVTLVQMIGLIAMPLIAQASIVYYDWRAGWLAVGATVLIVGFVPAWLFLVRRPEDAGLVPDGFAALHKSTSAENAAKAARPPEPSFTRGQALRTPSFWLLSLYTVLVYPVQAGISLHQAPHLIERGLDPTIAATVVGTFSAFSAIAALGYGALARKLPINLSLASIGAALGASALLMIDITSASEAYVAASLFGTGIGGLLTMLPIAWADFFGRRSFGAIRGIALTVQVSAQAAGPLISGIARDLTGDYVLSLTILTGFAFAGGLIALITRPPALVTPDEHGER